MSMSYTTGNFSGQPWQPLSSMSLLIILNPARSATFEPSTFFVGLEKRTKSFPSLDIALISFTGSGTTLSGATGGSFLPHPKADNATTKSNTNRRGAEAQSLFIFIKEQRVFSASPRLCGSSISLSLLYPFNPLLDLFQGSPACYVPAVYLSFNCYIIKDILFKGI